VSVRLCRETRDGLYSVGHYLTFKFVEEAALSLATSLMLSIIVFLGTGLRGNFLLFWLVYWITSCTGIGKVWRYVCNVEVLKLRYNP